VRYAGQTHGQRAHRSANESGPGALAAYLGLGKLELKIVLLSGALEHAMHAFNAAAEAAGQPGISRITSTGLGETLVQALRGGGGGLGDGSVNWTQAGLGMAHQRLTELHACEANCLARGIKAVQDLFVADVVPQSSCVPMGAGIECTDTTTMQQLHTAVATTWPKECEQQRRRLCTVLDRHAPCWGPSRTARAAAVPLLARQRCVPP
jgi:hypothetical protein